jgi:hypothetical protein
MREEAYLIDFTGSPGRIRNQGENAGNFRCCVAMRHPDTPTYAPADDWLLLNISGRS